MTRRSAQFLLAVEAGTSATNMVAEPRVLETTAAIPDELSVAELVKLLGCFP